MFPSHKPEIEILTFRVHLERLGLQRAAVFHNGGADLIGESLAVGCALHQGRVVGVG